MYGELMSDDKKEKKEVFGQYTVEEVAVIEFGHYYLQVGADIFSYNDKLAFSRDRAEHFYDSVLRDLIVMEKSKDPVAKQDAKSCMLHLRICKMRLH